MGTMDRPRGRRGGALLGMLALVGGATACDPEPPPPPPTVFEVTAADDLPDAAPGDGVCEATPGAGDCTVRAGIEEANALGPVVLHLPLDPPHVITGDLAVTGWVHLVGSRNGSVRTSIGPGQDDLFATYRLDVAAGATLQVEDVDLSGLALRVAGDAALVRGTTGAFDPPGATLTVLPGGAAVAQDTWLTAVSGTAVRNHGTLLVDQSTIGGVWEHPTPTSPDGSIGLGTLTTETGGQTYLRGTWVASDVCVGEAPTSLGHNAESGTSCGFTGATDRSGLPPMSGLSPVLQLPSGPLVDAIPLGEGACGTVPVDINGVERPRDGDGDGIAACDIGARER